MPTLAIVTATSTSTAITLRSAQGPHQHSFATQYKTLSPAGESGGPPKPVDRGN